MSIVSNRLDCNHHCKHDSVLVWKHSQYYYSPEVDGWECHRCLPEAWADSPGQSPGVRWASRATIPPAHQYSAPKPSLCPPCGRPTRPALLPCCHTELSQVHAAKQNKVKETKITTATSLYISQVHITFDSRTYKTYVIQCKSERKETQFWSTIAQNL